MQRQIRTTTALPGMFIHGAGYWDINKQLFIQVGFPKGKENRNAYLKAVAELEARMVLAKVFSEDTDDTGMYHVSIARLYNGIVKQAQELTNEVAYLTFADCYLRHAVFILPKTLAKHLRIESDRLVDVLEHLVNTHQLVKTNFDGFKEAIYFHSNERRG